MKLITYKEAVKILGVAACTFSNGIRQGIYHASIVGTKHSVKDPQKWNKSKLEEEKALYDEKMRIKKARKSLRSKDKTYYSERFNSPTTEYKLAEQLFNQQIRNR